MARLSPRGARRAMPTAQDGDAGSDWPGPPRPDTIGSMETIEAPIGVRRVADLRLRGPAGSDRRPGPLAALAVGAARRGDLPPRRRTRGRREHEDDPLGHELCSSAGAVVSATLGAAAAGRARPGRGGAQWAADHGEELGADPGRLVVAGHGAGAAAAAALALRAHDRGWPPLRRQVLIVGAGTRRPATYAAASVPAAGRARGGHPGGQSERCAAWLRRRAPTSKRCAASPISRPPLRAAFEDR